VPFPSLGDPVLAEIVRRLIAFYSPDRVYLFGSAARGDAGPDSDLDFMVVVPDNVPPQVRSSPAIYKALIDFRVPIDVLVWTRSEFEKRLHLRVSFPSIIVREGKLLYAA
jgi:predicted nucleotidyltransferase